jgi:hypothetical protein
MGGNVSVSDIKVSSRSYSFVFSISYERRTRLSVDVPTGARKHIDAPYSLVINEALTQQHKHLKQKV